MSIKSIVQLVPAEFSNKHVALRIRSNEVTEFGQELQDLIINLVDTMKAHDIAIGLAAPQIGVSSRVAVVNLSEQKHEPTLVIVNPIIVSQSGKRDKKKESCMSVPHFRGEVERRERIAVRYQDETGAYKHLEAKGFLARVLSHEIDHLDGLLYLDRMKDSNALEPVEFFKASAGR